MKDEGLPPITQAKLDQSIDKIAAIGQLLTNHRWSKIWFNIDLLSGIAEGVTAQEVVDATGIPQSTVYQDLDEMIEAGCIELLTQDRPREYTSVSVQMYVSEQPGGHGQEYYVTPNLIGVVGEAYEDDDISLFLSRNSYTVLDYLISETMRMLSKEGVDCSLTEYLNESASIDDIDLNLIEPAIRRVLKEQIKNPHFDWEISEW